MTEVRFDSRIACEEVYGDSPTPAEREEAARFDDDGDDFELNPPCPDRTRIYIDDDDFELNP